MAGLVFSPDGARLATGSDDSSVRVWDVESGTQLAKLEGHSRPVTGLAFASDGARLVTASADSTIILWPTPWAALPLACARTQLPRLRDGRRHL